MTAEQIQRILEYLKNTGEYLASKGFQLAYRQAIYYGISDIFWAAGFLILLIISLKIFFHWSKKKTERHSEDEEKEMYMAISGFSGVLSFVGLLIFVNCSLGWLMNPEFGAVRILFHLVK